jgi:2-polyprenyl-3-methyl-5-hydroxy-6-metoxy-1,4-benzoquinol methylase
VSAQPRCLDIGCGAARNSLPLAALGFHVVAADLSAPMIAAARAARPGAGLFLFTFSRAKAGVPL